MKLGAFVCIHKYSLTWCYILQRSEYENWGIWTPQKYSISVTGSKITFCDLDPGSFPIRTANLWFKSTRCFVGSITKYKIFTEKMKNKQKDDTPWDCEIPMNECAGQLLRFIWSSVFDSKNVMIFINNFVLIYFLDTFFLNSQTPNKLQTLIVCQKKRNPK